MKKFSELKENEEIYIFYDDGIIAKNINKIYYKSPATFVGLFCF